MKTLIILSAIPASGKSTWAANYRATHENVYIVSSDEIRVELTNDYHDRSKQDEVWKIFSERIHEYGAYENATVILDALNDLDLLREKYVKENPEFDKYILVMFPADVKRSIKYNSMRPEEIRVPDFALQQLVAKFQQPSERIKNLFDEIWEIRWKETVK